MNDKTVSLEEYSDSAISEKELIKMFFFDEAAIWEMSKSEQMIIADKIVDSLNNISIDDILTIIIDNCEAINKITTKNIPQFSDLNHIDRVVKIVASSVDDLDYRKIGYFFNKDGKEGAQRKYGENHYKLAAAMGLVTLEKPYITTEIYVPYSKLKKTDQKNFRVKLLLRIPIIQTICASAMLKNYSAMKLLTEYLSYSTAMRRCSSVRQVIKLVSQNLNRENAVIIEKNLDWGE